MAMDPEERKARKRERQRLWAEANPDYAKQYREATRERRLAYMRKWREANPDHAKNQSRQWRESNPERAREARREYYWANRERRLEASSRWAQENRERRNRAAREWRAANPEAVSAWARQYREANRETFRARQNARRAQMQGEGVGLTLQEWLDLLEEFDHSCAYCQARGVRLVQEHMTPLIRGGRHTKSNVVPACGPCNNRKYTATLFEFAGKGLPS